MTAHFKMLKRLSAPHLESLGTDRVGWGSLITEQQLGSQKNAKTHQLSAEDTILSLWS